MGFVQFDTERFARVYGWAYRGWGCKGTPVNGGVAWRRPIRIEPVTLDETTDIVDSRSATLVTPGEDGLFEVVLWPGMWQATLADGEQVSFTVEAGDDVTLTYLRGYVPPPGTTVKVVALEGVDVTTLGPNDPATGDWSVNRLKLGIPRGQQGDAAPLPVITAYATAAQGALADTALQPSTGQTINAQTGTTYTLVASDAGKLVTLTNSAAITLTVPGNVFTAGQRVDCLVADAGMVTAVGSSCTVSGTPFLVSRAQWSAFTVLFTSATTAVMIGDLA